MAFSFSNTDIDRIASVLNAAPRREDGRQALVRFELQDAPSGRHVALEILTALDLPDTETPPKKRPPETPPANLISAYASSSFLQLQGCTGYIASQELGEVIFFARRGGATSGLVIERQAGCSLYANVSDYLLSSDFTRLPPELVMSSVALSMTESIFNDFE